jgi:hypothetical protein
MRFLIHAKVPTEAGNLKVQDPNLLSKLETYIDNVHQHRSNVRTLQLFLQILLSRQMRLYRNQINPETILSYNNPTGYLPEQNVP